VRDNWDCACESLPSVLARVRPIWRVVVFTRSPSQSTGAWSRLICRSHQRLHASDELWPVGSPDLVVVDDDTQSMSRAIATGIVRLSICQTLQVPSFPWVYLVGNSPHAAAMV
jgi:hypothetical protein